MTSTEEEREAREARLKQEAKENAKFYADLVLGSTVHAHDGGGRFVRCEVVEDGDGVSLRRVALVGPWSASSLAPDSWQRKHLGETFLPSAINIWENPKAPCSKLASPKYAWPRTHGYVSRSFSLDADEEPVVRSGVTDGSRWNGWATPWFTKEVALEVLSAMSGISWSYDEESDTFRGLFDDCPEEEAEEWKGRDIDGEVRYSIGAWSWCWNLETEVL